MPGSISGVRGIVAAVSVVLAGACAPLRPEGIPDDQLPVGADPSSLAARAAGCWIVEWGASTVPGDAPLPDSIDLAGAPLRPDRTRVVAPATDPTGRGFDEPPGRSGPTTWEQAYRTNRWWVEGDRVLIAFEGEAAEPWTLDLAFQGEGLAGRAERGVGRAGGSAVDRVPVLLTAIDCLFGTGIR